jgi:aminoacyl tRNA synthase complex-interacting multifunctional protein 1
MKGKPDATPLTQLNPKKKIFETIQPGRYISFELLHLIYHGFTIPLGLTTLDTKEAAWINPVTKSVHRIRTENGVCHAPTFVGASLS